MRERIRLGPRQKEYLSRVVRTNGGGVYSPCGEDYRIMRSLEAKGLIQGKLGQPYYAVHTRKGLELYRADQPTPEKG